MISGEKGVMTMTVRGLFGMDDLGEFPDLGSATRATLGTAIQKVGETGESQSYVVEDGSMVLRDVRIIVFPGGER